MHVFKNPTWLNQFSYPYKTFEEIPASVFDTINQDLMRVQSTEPLVSIIIAAWNEEINILHCLASLSKTKTSIPFEIIVVNNNSTDNTQQVLDKLKVKNLFQKIQGCGPARQLGSENAKGKYILLADADCYYPTCWVDEMMKVLQRPGVVCVYGRYSFIPEPGFQRWKLFLMEKLKDIIADIRHLKRPYLNAYGISMGYVKEYGLKVGYVKYNIRGDDGRLCFDLMQFGKVVQVRSDRARAWTRPRTLQKDGSLSNAFRKRIIVEIKRFNKLLTPLPPHDTKTSLND
ncbi:glycosyltransferase [Pontibacter diazotrophicus]|uniref:Glycosyltransferase n=1 Tax=Pontibacter diazotrophicus TaxID=1400979 RepID=A0A3D8LH46_9BACT|nr:glycosyltransferase family 2 protein [Pontibacter diazotrophicus]RDV16688.1 glycosyltransferase [Pontibacter diazotrophicus]